MASKKGQNINSKSGKPERRWQDESNGVDKQWIRKQKDRITERDLQDQLNDFGIPLDE